MYNGKKILALIPARGGSKGIKDKNIINLCGKPLISYSIQSALDSKYVDDVIVSTDSPKIADVAIKYGAQVPFMRPSELASDTSCTIDVVMHAMDFLRQRGKEYNTLVLLQPTSPLRTTYDIDGAVEKHYFNDEMSLVSVSEVNDNPLLIRTVENDRLVSLLDKNSTCRRQDMKKYYRVNGSIYINKIDSINLNTSFNDNIIPYIIDRNRAVDIDELVDINICQYYLGEKR